LERVRVSIIGLGGIGKVHLHNALDLDNANLVAVADKSKKSRFLAAKLGVKKQYSDYGELLQDPEIDCVLICLPTFLHAEAAIEAVKQGKHVFVEKPLARNVEEGKRILAESSKNSVKTMIGYPLHFEPGFRGLKSQIDSGRFGDVVISCATNVSSGPFSHRASNSIPQPVPSWWLNKELAGGGALMDLGSHMINLLCWYFGSEIDSVDAVLGHRYNLDFEDYGLARIRFRTGTLGVVNFGWFSQTAELKVEILGTIDNKCVRKKSEGSFPTKIIQILKGGVVNKSSGLYNELKYFIDCIRYDLDPYPSVQQGLRDLEIISRAYRNQVQKKESSFGNCESSENK